MKKINVLIIIILLSFNHNLRAQGENINLHNIVAPFADGERTLNFGLELVDATSVYVFYSDNRSDLTTVSLENNGNDVPHGKAILYERQAGTIIDCSFSFPNKSSIWPNMDLFLLEEERRSTGLINNSFISQNDRNALNATQGTQIDLRKTNYSPQTDKNPKKYRKECINYRVLSVNLVTNTQKLSAIKEFYMPDDFTIGLVGDSFASGVGADIDPPNACYRSSRSGQILGVKHFIKKNPNISVDYKHAACGGAQIENLYAINQTGTLGIETPNEGTQFDMLKSWMRAKNHNELNMLIMNIGGNNIGFGGIVFKYHVLPLNFDNSEDESLHIPRALRDLGNSFNGLSNEINREFPLTMTTLTSLPNVFRNRSNQLCCDRLSDLHEYLCAGADPIFSPPLEFQALQNSVLRPLNRVFSAEANEHNWDYLDVTNNSNQNGICVCESEGGYFWNFRDAGLTGDIIKTAHPNRNGHKAIYEESISNYIENKYFNHFAPFYPLRVALNDIETPDCAPYYEQWLTSYKISTKHKLPKGFSIVDRNRFQQSRKSINSKKITKKDAKKFLLNYQKKSIASSKKNAKPKTKYVPKKNTFKLKLDKELLETQKNPAYIKWVKSKTEKEAGINFKILQKVLETSLKKEKPKQPRKLKLQNRKINN